MKSKDLIYGLLLLFFPLFMASCLDEGGNEITLASQPAVVKLGANNTKMLMLKGGDRILSETLNNNAEIEIGDCGLADFVLDYSDPLNINSKEDSMYTVKSLKFEKIDKAQLQSTLSDTSRVMSGEKIVTAIREKSLLMENNLFLFTEHTMKFDLGEINFSYDKSSAPTVEQGGSRVYTIYMRIVGDSINTQKEIKYNVLALDSLLVNQAGLEQTAGVDSINFRIKYLSAIKSDSTAAWKTSQQYTIRLPEK